MGSTVLSTEPKGGVLYLVATPIGNLNDLSQRAINILSNVDLIAAEDTRVSLKLLNRFEIKKPLISYHEHNCKSAGEKIVAELKCARSVALVTDAGSPAISDPGEDIVKKCAEEGISVVAIPGACAAVCALSLSALSTGRFCFEGFLPTDNSPRKKRLEKLKTEERTMIFYEAPHRLKKTLGYLLESFGEDRKISLCRELTKLNEEVLRFTLKEAAEYFSEKEPKGEFVLILEGAREEDLEEDYSSLSLEDHLKIYLDRGLSNMDAVKAVAKDRKLSKSEVYSALMVK